jgi:uncharacterized protein YjbJ (UPF0337 family)
MRAQWNPCTASGDVHRSGTSNPPPVLTTNVLTHGTRTIAIQPGNSYIPQHHPSATHSFEENVMDKNRVEGEAMQLKGSVREAIGKVTGNRMTQAEGAAEKLAGRMQAKLGEAVDALRDRAKR